MTKLCSRMIHLLVAGMFLASAGGDALGLHECPHHSGLAGHSSAAQDMPDVHAAAGPAHHGSSDSEQHDGPCTCVGQCSAATGIAVLGATTSIEPAAETAVRTVPSRPATAPALGRIPYLIPFANAPPA